MDGNRMICPMWCILRHPLPKKKVMLIQKLEDINTLQQYCNEMK